MQSFQWVPTPVTSLISRRFSHGGPTSPPSPSQRLHQPATTSSTVTTPHHLVRVELARLHDVIKTELSTGKAGLRAVSHYHFDGKGKSFRPMLTMVLAKALNYNTDGSNHLSADQEKIAQITEMIHVASLIHDDVIDGSDVRRGVPSVHQSWNHNMAVIAGNYILSSASAAIARLGDPRVVTILSRVIDDLVRGEFMQLGSKENENERFQHYLEKTYKKTASLMANSCQSVAVLNNSGPEIENTAYHIGRNVGIAFQLTDDLLDFVSSDLMMGKPTVADLRLGLATGPVLFACQKVAVLNNSGPEIENTAYHIGRNVGIAFQLTDDLLDFYPDLHAMIMRRFSEDGDVQRAREFVEQSDGLHQTRLLAQAHCQDARKLINSLRESPARNALNDLTHMVLNRKT